LSYPGGSHNLVS